MTKHSHAAYRPRRTVLYVPASNERAVEKAATLPVDALILDLEDSIAPDGKEAAREAAVAAVKAKRFGRREVTIRINGVGSDWHWDDMRAACKAAPDGIVVPKVNSRKEVRDLVRELERLGAPARTKLWAMVETPQAILEVDKLASASSRLGVLVMGTNDLVKELDCQHVAGREPLLYALSKAVLAARAAGVAIVDGVYNDVKDAEGFAAECTQGRAMGFDGKTIIHPGQVDPCNAAYAPSDTQVADAEGLILAFDAAKAEGRGVCTYNGKLVEQLHVDMARKVLATRAAIEALQSEG
ncbi:MAG TPA: CoA ester lyase [Dermatophilaceae bacterium]|nr:CoA ester lyase [Dermatophilaceae bacterium]